MQNSLEDLAYALDVEGIEVLTVSLNTQPSLARLEYSVSDEIIVVRCKASEPAKKKGMQGVSYVTPDFKDLSVHDIMIMKVKGLYCTNMIDCR